MNDIYPIDSFNVNQLLLVLWCMNVSMVAQCAQCPHYCLFKTYFVSAPALADGAT